MWVCKKFADEFHHSNSCRKVMWDCPNVPSSPHGTGGYHIVRGRDTNHCHAKKKKTCISIVIYLQYVFVVTCTNIVHQTMIHADLSQVIHDLASYIYMTGIVDIAFIGPDSHLVLVFVCH